MRKPILIILISVTTAMTGHSQKPWQLGPEYIRYIGKGFNSSTLGARYESFPGKASWSIGLTYHLSSKKSYSAYKGIGMYMGIRYGFGGDGGNGNVFIGARAMLAFVNFEGKTNLNSLMFTPWAEAGYQFLFGNHFFASPSIGYGYNKKITKEFNSLDEDEGGRIIPGLSAGYRF